MEHIQVNINNTASWLHPRHSFFNKWHEILSIVCTCLLWTMQRKMQLASVATFSQLSKLALKKHDVPNEMPYQPDLRLVEHPTPSHSSRIQTILPPIQGSETHGITCEPLHWTEITDVVLEMLATPKTDTAGGSWMHVCKSLSHHFWGSIAELWRAFGSTCWFRLRPRPQRFEKETQLKKY